MVSHSSSRGHINSDVNIIARCRMTNVKLRSKNEPDVFTSEQFGVAVEPLCNSCKSCKECSFQNNQLTYREQEEQEELKVIQSKLKLDTKRKKWIAEYP